MKTLFLTIQYPPHVGGVPRFYYHITRFFSADELCVLTAKEPGWQDVDNKLSVKVHRLKLLNYYKTKNIAFFAFINIIMLYYTIIVSLKEKVGSIIAGHSNIPLLTICYICKVVMGKKYTVFVHGDGDSPAVHCKSDVFKKHLYKNASNFIVNSIFTKRRLMDKFAVSDERITVLYPGVDIGIFYMKDAGRLRKTLGLNNRKIILTAGRVDKRKGHDSVLHALPAVIREVPDVVYLIVGKGRYQPEIIRLAKEMKIESHVIFTGYVPDSELSDYYNLCDVFIMPNRELDDGDTEGFGMVFIEANACGKPVIGGRCGGVVEAIVDNETGLLVDPYDPEDISIKLINLLRDKNIAKRLGETGRRRAENDFEWQKHLSRHISRIKELVAE